MEKKKRSVPGNPANQITDRLRIGLASHRKDAAMLTLALYLLLHPVMLLGNTVELTIVNVTPADTIASVHSILPGEQSLVHYLLDTPIPPGSTGKVDIPSATYDRLIFCTESGTNYREVLLPVGRHMDTVTVSRADREYGEFFDVVLGSRPFVLMNSSPVPLSGVYLLKPDITPRNMLGKNPLLTDEFIVIWLDADSAMARAEDIEGHFSREVSLISSSGSPATYTLGPMDFLPEGTLDQQGVTVLNCINGAAIIEVEIYPFIGEPFIVDAKADPLELWEWMHLSIEDGAEFVVCYDEQGRSFTVPWPEDSSGVFIASWWNLDFDFNFPGEED
ncbi:MAG TPA: hypothetical protein PLM29_04120 [Deltaproteobacteria bacterium]|nr:hypothetical protein [Deltaproteobacteria bacterium]